MSTSLRHRIRGWAADPVQPYVTGGVLTLFAVLEHQFYPLEPLVLLSVMVCATSLMWRGRHPWTAFLSIGAFMVGFALDENLSFVALISLVVAWYTLGRRRVRHPAAVVATGALASFGVNLVHIDRWMHATPVFHTSLRKGDVFSLSLYAETFVLTVACLAAVSVGDAMRARAETRRERALTQARLIAIERRRAVEAERAAIARELHDVISHSVSMIAVQAESATYTTPDLTPQARDGFQEIAATARSSMSELRRLLGVLRSPQDAGAVAAPQPTLAQVDELLEQHRSVGGMAELRFTGDRVTLGTAWELSAYRIVQESLTNARKHAPGARTVIEIGYHPDRLTLHIADDGPGRGPAPLPDGHGLAGMRERAALVGGRLSAGAGPDGGFLVQAELPW